LQGVNILTNWQFLRANILTHQQDLQAPHEIAIVV
jgi:hypothetical protein